MSRVHELNCTPEVRQYDILKLTEGAQFYAKRDSEQTLYSRIQRTCNRDDAHRETARQFEINDRGIIKRWKRIYLEEGSEGFNVERRGRASAANGTRKGCPSKLDKQIEEGL
jgi:hypothetical protein